ncbi:MAG TPA: hypothetical protein EYN54_12060 [Methylococcaceae bacterium]|nr:hypothetical protein [Methylococcaceae bacterium]
MFEWHKKTKLAKKKLAAIEIQKGNMLINSEVNHHALVDYIRTTDVKVVSKAMMLFVDYEHVICSGHLTTFHDENGKIVRFS